MSVVTTAMICGSRPGRCRCRPERRSRAASLIQVRRPRDGRAEPADAALGATPATSSVLGRRPLHRRRPATQQADEQRQHHLQHVIGGAGIVDRAAPEAARVHPHLDLVDPQAVALQHQDRLDLRVVVRVVAGEQLDAAAVDHPEAGGRIGDPLPGDRGQDDREDHVAEPPPERDLVAGVAAEAGAVDHVGLGLRRVQGGEHLRQVLRLVLAVAVDLDGDVVALVQRVLVARLHRAADPEVERMAEHRRSRA